MRVDGRIDQIAAEPPEPRQGAILVRSREPAVADDIRDQDRRNLAGSRHAGPSSVTDSSTKTVRNPGGYMLRAIEPKEDVEPKVERRLWTI